VTTNGSPSSAATKTTKSRQPFYVYYMGPLTKIRNHGWADWLALVWGKPRANRLGGKEEKSLDTVQADT
jgi:hypothetical protein